MERLEAAAIKRKQPIPEFVVKRPELPAECIFYYTAYCDLQANGFNFGETKMYAEHYGVSFERLRYVLRTMNNARGD